MCIMGIQGAVWFLLSSAEHTGQAGETPGPGAGKHG